MHETHISHKHTHTLQQIFQHPTSHNLEWHDIVALMRHTGTVQEKDASHVVFTLNGVSETFVRPHDKPIATIEHVALIRQFLENAGVSKDGAIATQGPVDAESSMSAKDQHSHDHGRENAEHNRQAEQQIKTQLHEQNDRSAFRGGDAQANQQGNKNQ